MLNFIRTLMSGGAVTRYFAVIAVAAGGQIASPYTFAQEAGAGEEERVPPEAIDAVVACAVCHGPSGEGKPALGTPRIGGLSESYLARQLEHFRESIRGENEEDAFGTRMRAMSLTLEGAAEVEAMARYFSTLEPPPAPESVNGDAERGKQLYAVCAACHGTGGEGNEELNAPALRGQHDWYIVRQLENFQQGWRGGNERDVYGKQMVPIVETLEGRQDFIDLAAYINTL